MRLCRAVQGAEQRLLCCSGSLGNTVLQADFLQCAHRGSKEGGDSDLPGLRSLVSLDALVCSGSQASSWSCLPPLLSFSWVLFLGWEPAEAVLVMQGGHSTGIFILRASCSYFTQVWLHIILYMQGNVVCKLMACDRVIFFIQEDTNSCCITKDTSPVPYSWMVGLNNLRGLFQP